VNFGYSVFRDQSQCVGGFMEGGGSIFSAGTKRDKSAFHSSLLLIAKHPRNISHPFS